MVLYGQDGAFLKANYSMQLKSNLAEAKQTRSRINFSNQTGNQDNRTVPQIIEGSSTTINVNGAHPYKLILEDYKTLPEKQLVERYIPIPNGHTLVRYDFENGGNDIIFSNGKETSRLRNLLKNESPKERRIGGPALLQDMPDGSSQIVIPSYTDKPGLKALFIENSRDIPETT